VIVQVYRRSEIDLGTLHQRLFVVLYCHFRYSDDINEVRIPFRKKFLISQGPGF